MSEKILIVRAVSFQQLDKNLEKIVQQFPNARFYLLTHAHGVENAQKYGLFQRVFDYESSKNFSFFHLPPALKQETFSAVVVPVTNITGVGFLNVFLMALRLKSKQIYCCNLCSQITRRSRPGIFGQLLKSIFYSISACIGVLVTLLILPFLLLPSLFRRKPAPQSFSNPTNAQTVPDPGKI